MTHGRDTGDHPGPANGRPPRLARGQGRGGTAVGALLAATVAVAGLSESLAGAIEPAAHALGMNDVFVGVVVAVVGNAAEHVTAVQMAWRDRMDVAVTIAVGSSTQAALFVAPVLVFASRLMGHARPLDLHFTPLEVAAAGLGVASQSAVAAPGDSYPRTLPVAGSIRCCLIRTGPNPVPYTVVCPGMTIAKILFVSIVPAFL